MEPGWDLAGFTDADGNLGRAAPTRPWMAAAEVRVAGGRLHYRVEPREVSPEPGMLSAFEGLADDGDGSRIVRFAERYGVLHLCEHDLPASHNPMPWPQPWPPSGGKVTWCLAEESESLDTWRLFAQQARAILRIAADLLQDRPGSDRDWGAVYARSGHPAPWWRRDGDQSGLVRVESVFLAAVVNEWLVLGNVRTRLDGHQLRMVLESGLFGAIAVQMASAISRREAIYLCDNCGQIIDTSGRQRAPQRGKRHYCDACVQAKIPARDRARASRLRRAGLKGTGL